MNRRFSFTTRLLSLALLVAFLAACGNGSLPDSWTSDNSQQRFSWQDSTSTEFNITDTRDNRIPVEVQESAAPSGSNAQAEAAKSQSFVFGEGLAPKVCDTIKSGQRTCKAVFRLQGADAQYKSKCLNSERMYGWMAERVNWAWKNNHTFSDHPKLQGSNADREYKFQNFVDAQVTNGDATNYGVFELSKCWDGTL